MCFTCTDDTDTDETTGTAKETDKNVEELKVYNITIIYIIVYYTLYYCFILYIYIVCVFTIPFNLSIIVQTKVRVWR